MNFSIYGGTRKVRARTRQISLLPSCPDGMAHLGRFLNRSIMAAKKKQQRNNEIITSPAIGRAFSFFRSSADNG